MIFFALPSTVIKNVQVQHPSGIRNSLEMQKKNKNNVGSGIFNAGFHAPYFSVNLNHLNI